MAPSTVKSDSRAPATVSRPSSGIKRSCHTWHTTTISRSHFEDFMLEMGADPRQAHVCCVPRQEVMEAYYQSKMSKGKARAPVAAPARDKKAPASLQTLHAPKSPSVEHALQVDFPLIGQATTTTPPTSYLKRVSRFATDRLSSSALALKLKAQAISAIDAHSCAAHTTSIRRTARDSLLAVADRQGVLPSVPVSPVTIAGNDEQGRLDTHSRRPSLVPSQRSTDTYASSSRLSRSPSFASVDTASSSEGPATPRPGSPLLTHELPVEITLAGIEQASRFRIPANCVTCKRTGSNFPSCSKCGDMWCSRRCRLTACQGGSHVCHPRTDSFLRIV
ncbi:hypothetical protein K474DRAFT_1667299 [Panus rudis PR-1116 ss-1]|nr:hypothetical protein K474DRAFT_1667299 [Panus rudis PR-1116 ss-1]